MDLPIFPIIEVAKNDSEVFENPLPEAFLQKFIAHLTNEISQMKDSCEFLKKSNKNLRVSKDKHLREIFPLTHGNMNDQILQQQLSLRVQSELGMYRMVGQRVDAMFVSYQRNNVEWRGSFEHKIQTLLGTDELFELSQPELEEKMKTLTAAAEKAQSELNDFGETTKANDELLEEEIRVMNEETKSISPLKSEIDTAQRRLQDKLKETQLKQQQDTNELLKEIANLQKKLKLYE